MFRQLFSILLVLCLLGLWHSQDLLVEAQSYQGVRVFEDVCEDCVVSDLTGYAIFPTDCTCFYTCLFVGTVKLSSMASQYVAYKKCCPCGTSFSLKAMTCVSYNNKLSTCFDRPETNPCNESDAGDLVPRTNPFEVPTDHYRGCHECEDVGGVVVPNPSCCESGTCFNGTACTSEACSIEAVCASLTEKELDDNCNCEQTEAPSSECPYQESPDSIYTYMGVEQMYVYACPPGQCWSQELCSCVQAFNNVSVDCVEILSINFTGTDPIPVDGNGNKVWATANNVTFTDEGVVFNQTDSYINAAGLAGIYMGNTGVFHIEFTPTEDDTSSVDSEQCLVGNCFEANNEREGFNDTISVVLEREGSKVGQNANVSNVIVSLTYQDTAFMSSADSMETVTLTINGAFEVDVAHELWIIFCGDEGEVAAGVYTGGTLVDFVKEDVTNVQQLVMQQSGFVFGICPSGDTYEGLISLIEIYTCKPIGDPEFEQVASNFSITL